MVFIITALATFLASLISSIFGGGFGLICVPAFYWIIKTFYPHLPDAMQIAIATCGLSSLPMGLMSTIRQIRYKGIDFQLYKKIVVFMTIGSLCGVLMAISIKSDNLKYVFSALVFIVAIWMAKFKPGKSKIITPPKNIFRLLSSCVGAISSMLGISILNVPFFIKCGVNIRTAIGTSSALIVSYSTIAIIWMICLGLPKFGVSSVQVGYANLPVFAAAVIPGLIGAAIGVKVVHILPEKTLKRAFIVVMLIASFSMLF
ncbi:sulfite exporter TauE/SafE family protein [Francisellaceae bacterium]|nr:sulfite exporter TauE/SafE family protein [Francisellaceae bacterium]MDA7742084.1 sulfite exporter TauE/SafE family protein [Francisellaceae bacterium]